VYQNTDDINKNTDIADKEVKDLANHVELIVKINKDINVNIKKNAQSSKEVLNSSKELINTVEYIKNSVNKFKL